MQLFAHQCATGRLLMRRQRYFVCDKRNWKKNGPIFFYVGNEADVTLYLNATGLMWESGPAFGAVLVVSNLCVFFCFFSF